MIIIGKHYQDSRGIVRFANDFDFKGIVRFYSIMHHDTETIRAWQGHKIETKYFFASKGSFMVNWIKIDHWENPSGDLNVNAQILTDKESEILIISPGHVNGFKALEPDSILIVFSDLNLEDSKNDDYRFPLEQFPFKSH